MDQRQARVLEGQYAGGDGHLERRAEGLGHGVGQAEFLLDVQVADAGGELYGLVHGVDPDYAVVAGRGLHHAHDVLVDLLGPPGAGDGLDHVPALEDLVEVVFAEHFIPGAGRAACDAGERHRVEVEAVAFGERGLVGGERRGGGAAGKGRRGSRAGDFQRPALVVRVEELAAALRGLAFPLYRDAQGRHVGQQVVELGDAAALGVVGGQDGDVRFVLQRGGGESAEHALGAALYESAHALGVHAFKLLDEFHGAGHLLDQHVVDALLVDGEEVRGNVGQDLHVRRFYRDVLEELAVRAHGRRHYFGMEGVAHGDLPRLYAQVLEHLDGGFHGLGFAGYHGLQRAVLVGADDIAFDLLQFYFHLVAAPGDGGHLAGVGYLDVGHFLGAAGNGAQAVLEGEDARGGGGGVLAQGVAYGHVGLYAEFLEQAVHRYVGGHHGRLGQLGLLDGGFALGQLFLALAGLAPDGVGQAHAYHFLQDHVGLVEGFLHDVVLGGQVPHHVHVLGALPGEQQPDLRVVLAGLEGVNAFQLEIERRRGPGFILGVPGQEVYLLRQVLRRLGYDGHAPGGLGLGLPRLGEDGNGVGFGPVRNGAAHGRPGLRYDVGGRGAGESYGLALYGGESGLRVFHYFGLRAGCGFSRGPGKPLVIRAGVFFHGHVEVGAAETERRNVGAADAVLLPLFRFGDHAEQVQVNAGIGLHVVDGGGQGLVVKGQGGFGYADRAGGGLGVADLGFNGGKSQLLPPAHVRAEHFLQHLHLGGVAHLGGGAVRFHEIHVGRGIVHPGESVLDGDLLALGIGGGDALALAVGGGAYGVHQGVDLVAVADRVGEAFKDINGNGFRHYEPVGPFVERIGTFGRQRADLAELHESRGAHHLVGAARHRHVELAGAQAQHGVIQRRHGGGAGRVHGHVGAVEIENIGYAAGGHVGQLAGHGVFGDVDDARVYASLVFFYHGALLVGRQRGERGGLLQDILVVELVDAQVGHFLAHRAHGVADDGGGHFRVERFLVVAGIFQGHAHGLYGHLLQAGDLRGGLGRDLVADRVELKAFYEAAYLGIGLVRGFVVFREIELPVPAVRRHFADAVAAFQDVLPERVLVKGFGGYYSKTDYRYFFIVHNLVAFLCWLVLFNPAPLLKGLPVVINCVG